MEESSIKSRKVKKEACRRFNSRSCSIAIAQRTEYAHDHAIISGVRGIQLEMYKLVHIVHVRLSGCCGMCMNLSVVCLRIWSCENSLTAVATASRLLGK